MSSHTFPCVSFCCKNWLVFPFTYSNTSSTFTVRCVFSSCHAQSHYTYQHESMSNISNPRTLSYLFKYTEQFLCILYAGLATEALRFVQVVVISYNQPLSCLHAMPSTSTCSLDVSLHCAILQEFLSPIVGRIRHAGIHSSALSGFIYEIGQLHIIIDDSP